ncbi:unnamed protein product [Oppiella nova]|uniref:Uncharacterized protein n=1 Tax=Oppiella nova TaxID=334625 RepID=A0A7R9QQL9_9ACAR|nr:unnamed protein product [Oppiella nova]CAG2172000.1 unnamed protein product [Oppiella nova]
MSVKEVLILYALIGFVWCDNKPFIEKDCNQMLLNLQQIANNDFDKSSDEYWLLMALYIDCNQMLDDYQSQLKFGTNSVNSVSKPNEWVDHMDDHMDDQVFRHKKNRKNRFTGVLTK